MSDIPRGSLKDLVRRSAVVEADPSEVDAYAEESNGAYRAFAQLRQPRATCLMVEFVFRTGNRRAFGYSWLIEARFDRSQGIELHFTGCKAIIQGRCLESLYVGLCRHLVFRVWEADDAAAMTVAEGMAFVERLQVEAT